MTYSIVARDEESGCFGLAVQSCVLGAGSSVPALGASAGVIAAQAGSPLWYRKALLSLLEQGFGAEEAGRAFSRLPDWEIAQVAIVDSHGSAFGHTGADCEAEAGHVVGDGVVTAANLMYRDTVWDAMITSYKSANGTFPDRLLEALRAAEAEGGDVRGRQSAAMMITPRVGAVGNDEERPYLGLDLRVDDHSEPVRELGRLLNVCRAQEELRASHQRIRKGGTWSGELASFERLRALAPEDALVTYWCAVILFGVGSSAEGRELLSTLRRGSGHWDEVAARDKLLATQDSRVEILRCLGRED